MNEIGSLFLATLVLAVGGVGLYVYKTPELYAQNGGDDEEDIEEENNEEKYDEPEIIETKTRSVKSKKNRRRTVGTKRRYY
jgi:hypothetical protein